MPFLHNLTHNIISHKQTSDKNRKEHKDSLMVTKRTPLINHKKERASAFTSKGSITLEAAVVVPFFFFAMLCLGYLLEAMAIQTTMRNALYSAGKELARQGYVENLVTTHEIEGCVISNVGTERLKRSIVAGGENGIDCSESVVNWNTGVMELSVKYQLKIPIFIIRVKPIPYEETIRVKSWCGYASGAGDLSKDDTVYVTDTGIVYHRDRDCTYLDMSVHAVPVAQIEELRNQSGGKYYACEFCRRSGEKENYYYVTDYGTRYHRSLECKKIQRNVYAISLDEAYGLGGCSKCVK